MNKIVYKLTAAVSTAALLTGSVASVAFGTTSVTVSGNGADSENEVKIDVKKTTSLVQTNTANIQNNVKINANTGDNSAEKNTGGDVAIDTGDANVSSSVSNSANSNVASLDCGTCPGNVDVKVSGNGADSENEVKLDFKNTTEVEQANVANIDNNVDVNANTGKNEADKNTGGEVSIETGDAGVVVDVVNMANANVAHLGGGESGSLNVEISGNGADSENEVEVDMDTEIKVRQTNYADIDNDVEVDANSGDNEADKNTGGEVNIDTGDANVEASVKNQANFNGLNLDDCCELDGDIKVSGNGADSENEVELDLETYVGASQDNDYDCDGRGGLELPWLTLFDNKEHGRGGNDCNDVDVDSNTGDNKVEDSTVGGEDPSVSTGDAGADIEVETEANSNVLGDMDFDLDLPDLGDLNGWFMLLKGHMSS